MLAASFLLSACAHGGNAPVRLSPATPSPTPYFGIQKAWKGFVPSVQGPVVVLWIQPNSAIGMEPVVAAHYVFSRLQSKMRQFHVAVIEVDQENRSGAFVQSRGTGWIFIHNADGSWRELENNPSDNALMNNLLKAGL